MVPAIQMWEKFAIIGRSPKYTKNVVYIRKVHFGCFIFGEQINFMETHKNTSHTKTQSREHMNLFNGEHFRIEPVNLKEYFIH